MYIPLRHISGRSNVTARLCLASMSWKARKGVYESRGGFIPWPRSLKPDRSCAGTVLIRDMNRRSVLVRNPIGRHEHAHGAIDDALGFLFRWRLFHAAK